MQDLTRLFGEDDVESYPLRVYFLNNSVIKLYDYLKTLDDEKLQELFNLLTASVFGSWYGFDPRPGDNPLPLAVANDLKIDMAQHFTLSDDFLKGYRKTGLLELLGNLGIESDFSSVQAKGIREHILKETKDKTYLPQLVKFFPMNAQVLEDKDDDDSELDAA